MDHRVTFFFFAVVLALCHATAPAFATTVVRQDKPWARKATGLLSTAPGGSTTANATIPNNSAFVCDSLVPEVCGYPFPSDFFRDVNGSGLLNLTAGSMPLTVDGRGVDPVAGGWDLLDGFSPLSPLLAYFPQLNIDTLPRYWDIQASLDENCPTVLVRGSEISAGDERKTRCPFWRKKKNRRIVCDALLASFEEDVVYMLCDLMIFPCCLSAFRFIRRKVSSPSLSLFSASPFIFSPTLFSYLPLCSCPSHTLSHSFFPLTFLPLP